MKLQLFTSKPGAADPNLVSLQHPGLAALPTILVCPLRPGVALTPLRVEIFLGGRSFVVACDLIRPINRQLLRPMGELDESASRMILATFLRLLAG
jgi:mRNA-degrading endonuclease toxin of MazEF toxin-antitoxin module